MTQSNQKLKIFSKFLIFGAILVFLISFSKKEDKQKKSFLSFFHPCPSFFIDPTKKNIPETPPFFTQEKYFLYSINPPFTIFPKVFAQLLEAETPNNEILIHQVKEGETLLAIAKNYNLKVETIAFANNLEDEKIIPGQELIIPPVDGAVHIVKEGETLEEIAKKYEVNLEDVLAFNEIVSPSEISDGQVLIVPGAKLKEPLKIQKKAPIFAGGVSSYPYGYCTWWVAQKRQIPSWGNAKDWLKNAKESGYEVCFGSYCEPKVGAIVSLKTRHPLGHVAYVEEVKDGKIIFSEMNYLGFGVVSKRSLKIGDPRILGYIY
jgi:surface antigen